MTDSRDEYRKEWSAEMRAAAAEDDAASSEKWNQGCDFAMTQLCTLLGVDPRMVNWDAATETVDGDVQAVIGNIFLVKFGEDWADRLCASLAAPRPAALLGGREAIDTALRAYFQSHFAPAKMSSDGVERVYCNGFPLNGLIDAILAIPQAIESECCREDSAAWEPCPPFAELQDENGLLRAALAVPVTVDEIEQMIAIEFGHSKITRHAAERVFNFLSARCDVRILKALKGAIPQERGVVERLLQDTLAEYEQTVEAAEKDTALSDTGRQRVIECCLDARGAVKVFAARLLAQESARPALNIAAVPDLKTDPELLALIERSKNHVMTPAETYEQQRSFARGACPSNRNFKEWCAEVDRLLPPGAVDGAKP